MAYKSKSSAINGWLVIDKNIGYSSTTIVNKVRWLLDARKAGHAGTLDPDATGILAIALGEATKTIPYLTDAPKTYIFKVNFGFSTDTDDASGKKINVSKIRPSDSQLDHIIKDFIGMIKQIPPKYSAVKINGNRAYELSQKGFTDFTLRPRDLHVKKLEIIQRINDDAIMMRMICGKGGYVRSIARDIGEKIGCYAHADQIRRISSGPFTLSNAISDQVIFQQNKTEIFKNILPVQSPLNELMRFDCQISEVNEIKNGKKIPILKKNLLKNSEAFVCFNNQPIAIGKIFNNYFYPKRVFSFYEDNNFDE